MRLGFDTENVPDDSPAAAAAGEPADTAAMHRGRGSRYEFDISRLPGIFPELEIFEQLGQGLSLIHI